MLPPKDKTLTDSSAEALENPEPAVQPDQQKTVEHGGPKGPEPTRYGDWERKGRCVDF